MPTIDSSAARFEAYEGLSSRNVFLLLELVGKLEMRETKHVEAEFVEQGEQYEKTLNFALSVGLVQSKRDGLVLRASMPLLQDAREAWLVRRLCRLNSTYRRAVFAYVRRFTGTDGVLEYRPIETERSREAPVRNFLMDLGVVEEQGNATYSLRPKFFRLYGLASAVGTMAPERLRRVLAAREEAGKEAENYVLNYELRRLGKAWREHIDHVAARDVSAGYDIESVTLNDGEQPRARFIEVKSFSGREMEFFWSSHEVGVARAFGEAYYVYLVRRRRGGAFTDEGLTIIPNAYRALFENAEWTIESSVFQCRHTRHVEVACGGKS